MSYLNKRFLLGAGFGVLLILLTIGVEQLVVPLVVAIAFSYIIGIAHVVILEVLGWENK